MGHFITRAHVGAGLAALLVTRTASAIDWNISGFVRPEIGVGIANNENEMNAMGNPFNARVMPVLTNIPANGAQLRTDGTRADTHTAPLPATCKFGLVNGCAALSAANSAGAALSDDYNFNLFSSRLELDIPARASTIASAPRCACAATTMPRRTSPTAASATSSASRSGTTAAPIHSRSMAPA